MKKLILLSASLLFVCSCQEYKAEELTQDAPASSASTKTKSVQFIMRGITEEYSTRATISSVGMTDLWVWEGSTLLKHQVSTDEDFGLPTVNLMYGSHDLTFVASKADSQSWADGVWSTTKEFDTFATTMNVTVSGGSSNIRQVQLTRRSAKVKFVTEDAIPSNVKSMHLTVGNHKSLDKDLKGGSAYTHEATVDISSKVGSTYSVSVNALTESAKDEEDCAVMIEFKDAQGNVLYHYERVVNLKPNRAVTLKGNYFSGESNSVTIASTDWDSVDQDLFPSE